MSARDHVRCPDCGGCLACGVHTEGVTCNGTSSALKGRLAGLEARVAALEGQEPAFLKDCRTDYFSEGLQGGGVRITHLPTGLSAEGHAKAGLKDLARELAGDLARMLAEQGHITEAEAQAARYVPPPATSPQPARGAGFTNAQVEAVASQVRRALVRQARANSRAARRESGEG